MVFQPHRHTRTRQYAAEFRQALLVADGALVLPVYSAGETAIEGGSAQSVVADSRLKLIEDRNHLPARLKELVDGQNAVVAFVGAGDIEHDAEKYALLLRREGLPALTKDLSEAVVGKLSVSTVLKANEPLAKHTTLGVGGVARWYAEPVSVADVKTLLQAAGELGLPYFVIGRGSNLWVPDEGYDGLIIHLAAESWGAIKLESGDRIRVGGGVRLKELCGIAAREGLQGFEFLEGIPGTIGGSLRMNAGAMNAWIFDLVESIEWVTPMGVVRHAKRDCFDALYRDCPQLHGAVVLSAVLKATGRATPEAIRQTMETYSQQRRQSQPRDPSAGCVFRNPTSHHAGRMIDDSGLKGVQVGSAMVSPIHANFIINKGEASAADVLGLMREVRRQVQLKHGQLLEPEIIALGREWRDLL